MTQKHLQTHVFIRGILPVCHWPQQTWDRRHKPSQHQKGKCSRMIRWEVGLCLAVYVLISDIQPLTDGTSSRTKHPNLASVGTSIWTFFQFPHVNIIHIVHSLYSFYRLPAECLSVCSSLLLIQLLLERQQLPEIPWRLVPGSWFWFWLWLNGRWWKTSPEGNGVYDSESWRSDETRTPKRSWQFVTVAESFTLQLADQSVPIRTERSDPGEGVCLSWPASAQIYQPFIESAFSVQNLWPTALCRLYGEWNWRRTICRSADHTLVTPWMSSLTVPLLLQVQMLGVAPSAVHTPYLSGWGWGHDGNGGSNVPVKHAQITLLDNI